MCLSLFSLSSPSLFLFCFPLMFVRCLLLGSSFSCCFSVILFIPYSFSRFLFAPSHFFHCFFAAIFFLDSQRAASESPALSASLHCRTVRLLSLCASAGSPILLQTARACPRSPNNHCLFTQPVSLFGHHQWLALGSVRITGPVPHTDLRALGSCSVALHARVRRAVDEKLR